MLESEFASLIRRTHNNIITCQIIVTEAEHQQDNWGLVTFTHDAGLEKALKELHVAGGASNSCLCLLIVVVSQVSSVLLCAHDNYGDT